MTKHGHKTIFPQQCFLVCPGLKVLLPIFLGILITAYSSLGSSDRPISEEADPVLMNEPLIKEIAEKRKCSPAQVCLYVHEDNFIFDQFKIYPLSTNLKYCGWISEMNITGTLPPLLFMAKT